MNIVSLKSGGMYFNTHGGGNYRFAGGNVGIGTNPTHLIELDSDTYGTTAGWTDSSDRNKKENFTKLGNVSLTPVNLGSWTGNGSTIDAIEYGAGASVNLTDTETLSRLALLPIFQYNFINDGDTNEMNSGAIKHIGPTAQDFYKSFGLGAADTRIKATDMAGVALAGINALYAKIQPLTGVLSIVPGVNAQCVVGDTRLRRRKRARPDAEFDEFEFDEICIRDIVAGDEIQSLDERTGKVVYSRVNALIEMGEQEVFELVTKSGRKIRTTGNHPFLARAGATMA